MPLTQQTLLLKELNDNCEHIEDLDLNDTPVASPSIAEELDAMSNATTRGSDLITSVAALHLDMAGTIRTNSLMGSEASSPDNEVGSGFGNSPVDLITPASAYSESMTDEDPAKVREF